MGQTCVFGTDVLYLSQTCHIWGIEFIIFCPDFVIFGTDL